MLKCLHIWDILLNFAIDKDKINPQNYKAMKTIYKGYYTINNGQEYEKEPWTDTNKNRLAQSLRQYGRKATPRGASYDWWICKADDDTHEFMNGTYQRPND